MSFLDQIKLNKIKLKESTTVVTNYDGTRYLESKNSKDIKLESSKYGFVVDNKPDCTPVCVFEEKLFLGSQDCVDLEILQKYLINNVLSVGIETPNMKLDDNFKIKSIFIPCLDLPETNLTDVLFKCNNFIEDCLRNNERVLVHCNAGVSRSSSVIIGYLILKMNYSYEEAYNTTKAARPCIQPNTGFVKQLKMLNK